jgi:hypothetical protein
MKDSIIFNFPFAKGDGAELKLREASSFAKKQTPLTPYEMKDFVIRNAEEYLHTYANRRAHIPSLTTPFARASIFSLISAFNFEVDVCSNIDITSVEAKARNSDKNSFCFFSLYS